MFPFVDWTTLIPPQEFEPFSPVFDSIMLKTTPVANPADLATSLVDDVVCRLDNSLFRKLKETAKEKSSKLNAPLMLAFFASMTDACLREEPEKTSETPLNVRSVSAVDLRARLGLPAAFMNNSASVVPVHTSFPEVKDGHVDGHDMWTLAKEAQQVMLDNIEKGEAFRLNDITKRGAFEEFGPYFAILCLWSNMGTCDVPTGTVENVEVHLRGIGNNPIISAHPITVEDGLSITFTYSPLLHKRETVEFVAERFVEHVRFLANAKQE